LANSFERLAQMHAKEFVLSSFEFIEDGLLLELTSFRVVDDRTHFRWSGKAQNEQAIQLAQIAFGDLSKLDRFIAARIGLDLNET